jgi:hypothetical protein
MTLNQLYNTVVVKGGVPTKYQRGAFYETLDEAQRELVRQRKALNRTVFRSQHNRCGKTVLFSMDGKGASTKGRDFLSHVESKRVAAALDRVGTLDAQVRLIRNALDGRKAGA